MPVTVPLWVVALSGIFSILVVKQMFGGIGCNFVNPALMGRLFHHGGMAGSRYAVCCSPHSDNDRF